MKIDFTELFCFVDDFFKFCKRKNISTNGCNSKPGPVPRLNKSEVITIILGYTKSNFDCFKNYYEQYIMNYHRHDFDLVSYKRFNSLIGDYLPDLAIMLSSMLKECDGLSLVDSTSIAVCKNYRISSHKVFKSMASRGKTTKGWFYGIKMHIITNLQGELVKVSFTAGNKDDRKQLLAMSKGIFGKIFGDRGYISKKLFQELFEKNCI